MCMPMPGRNSRHLQEPEAGVLRKLETRVPGCARASETTEMLYDMAVWQSFSLVLAALQAPPLRLHDL